MIEWVPIKDWKFKEYEVCIVRFAYSTGGHGYDLIHNKNGLNEYANKIVTHIAAVNPPVEKTLEQKFEEFRVDVNKGLLHIHNLQSYTYNLAQIAKEHYEGKE